ncbi:ion channel [Trichothermofontia sichuanensis B231]|uniref:ion channel n=1 Tax=Trichothermofontia sichuanensis TaxID=3045816 RepID=UPI002244FDFF|nr:ion channel [Trichothermofontia sichuanensis]UZQ53303.1 ion channel [Trichothermofontia sichuanensis B231]
MLEFSAFIERHFYDQSIIIIYIFNLLMLGIYTVFFVFVTIRLVSFISQQKYVNSDVIYGSISGYLLLGITSAFLLSSVEYLMPNSFAINTDVSTHEEMFRTLFYYSFVTLATIGYGDITPVTPLARTLSITLRIVGQMYLTILIAILVSKYLNSQRPD